MRWTNVDRQIGKTLLQAREVNSGRVRSPPLVFMGAAWDASHNMPKVVVIAGPNGAGKSTTAPAVLRNALQVREFVNADTIAAGLSAFSPETVAIAAGRLMLDRVRELARERRDFAFETTLSSRSFAPWLKELRTDGYTFHLVYLWLPTVELALARVAERVRRGGHAIPEDTVRRRYDRSLANFFALYSRFADSWVMLDNSIRRRARVIAKRPIGRSIRVFDADRWHTLRSKYEQEDSNGS
jgi:predicted ABC-type ATPase